MWRVYLAPQNIPRAISVLTLGNKVMLYCIDLYCIVSDWTGLERHVPEPHRVTSVRTRLFQETLFCDRQEQINSHFTTYYSRHPHLPTPSPPPPPHPTPTPHTHTLLPHTSRPPPSPPTHRPKPPTSTPSYAGSKTVTDLWNRRVGAKRLQQLTGCDVGQHQRLGHLDNGVHVGRQMAQHLLRLVQLPHCCFDLMMITMVTMMMIIIMIITTMVHFYRAYPVIALDFFQTTMMLIIIIITIMMIIIIIMIMVHFYRAYPVMALDFFFFFFSLTGVTSVRWRKWFTETGQTITVKCQIHRRLKLLLGLY